MTLDGDRLDVFNAPIARKKLGITGGGDGPVSLLQDTITVSENIPAFSFVTALGKVADSGNPSNSLGKVAGISLAPIANGFSGAIAMAGKVINSGWSWAVGDSIYLNGTTLSASPPSAGFVQRIGLARSPTEISIDIGIPVLT